MVKRKKRVPYPDISRGASVTETTGLMPKVPDDAAEYASDMDVYGMQIPKKNPLDDRSRSKTH